MKKVIITGANGFIGKALTKALLEKNIVVYAVVRDKGKMKDLAQFDNLRIIEASFEDYKDLPYKIKDDIDVFYHLAWEGVFGAAFKDYELQLKNTKYACDAIMSAIQIRCKKFILAGTINELEVKKYMNMDVIKPRFTCIYGTAKLASEMICKTLAFNYGIAFNTGLIAMAYGVNDPSLMLPIILIKKLLAGEKPQLVEGNYLYDWICIDDIANAFIEIGQKGKNFKSYYIGHPKLRTFREIIEEVRDIINPAIELTFGEIKDASYIDYSQIDLEALYNDTGFLPACDFRESILKTAEWIRTLKG